MLPQKLTLPLMQTRWAQQLDPIISNELLQGQMLTAVKLINGQTAVNHGLQRKLLGYFIVGNNTQSTIWDSQASNQMPQLTLLLNSNAATTVNLWVF